MRVRLNPRFAGKATLAVVSDRCMTSASSTSRLPAPTIAFPFSADWGPGAYLVVMAHRPLDQAAKRMPGRSLGTAWFEIDQDAADR